MIVVFILFVLVVSAVLFLVAPYARRLPWDYGREGEGSALQERKEAALVTIHDLDFDYAAGKMSEEDHQKLRRGFKREAVDILKEIDRETAPGPEGGVSTALHRSIQKEVSRIRGLREAGG
jgi:hypothetical protein